MQRQETASKIESISYKTKATFPAMDFSDLKTPLCLNVAARLIARLLNAPIFPHLR